MQDIPSEDKGRWEKLTQEEFSQLVKSRGYTIREDGTVYLPGVHHLLGIIGEFDKDHFVIRLFENDRYFFKKDPEMTVEEVAEKLAGFIKEKIGEEGKLDSEFYLE